MSTSRMTLNASGRTLLGRKVKQLRQTGKIPANIYLKNQPSTAITLDLKDFSKLYSQAGETTLIDLLVDGGVARPVLIREVTRHPVTAAILHVDFQQVNLKQKVSAQIPVETVGESEAVKNGAVLVVVYNEIGVEALPTDLPEKFEVDLNKLVAIGDDIKVSDLKFDRNTITIDLEDDEVIATLQAQEEEKVEEVVTEPVEVELTKQGATKEEAATDAGTPAPAKTE